jgi:hypothetical protein
MLRFHRFSVLAILAACAPLSVWADDPGAGGGGGGGNSDPAKAQGFSQADLDAAVQKALAARDMQHAEQFKAATGHDSLQALQEAEAKRKGEEGKLLEQRNAELSQARTELDRLRIEGAILSAAGEAVKPDLLVSLLSGNAKVDNGTVTINGKPPAEAVKAYLAENPFLAKAAGGSGGGTPQGGGGTGEKNPWHPDTLNLTEQGRIQRADPQKAERMKAEAKAAKKS